MTQQSVTSTQQVATPKKGRRQQRVGRVVSNKMNKTIVVVVETLKKHRIYKRTYKQTKRFQAHDEENICQIGDLVRIEECRPLSKMKRWRLIEIIKPSSGIVPVEEVLAEADPDLSSEESESDESDEAEE
ncbi:MAG: 30S ribosomal protein S17 [Chloroflexota bacterium]|nr:MAG: 30S ribosomal protein S17 [Chloroflexota bacterium]TMD49771.1 MAG: 30S ribosomal protein S17 [Chloroflexota bacterium]